MWPDDRIRERERQFDKLKSEGKAFSSGGPPTAKPRGQFSAAAGTDPRTLGGEHADFIEASVIIIAESEAGELAADMIQAAKLTESAFTDRTLHFRISTWKGKPGLDGVLEVWRRYEDYVKQPTRSEEIAKIALVAYSRALIGLGYSVRAP